jgi:hypothetical protein
VFKPIIFNLLIILTLSIFIELININRAFSQDIINEQETIYNDNLIDSNNCQNINIECIDDLSNKAIANSLVIAELENKIELVEKQIDYLQEKISYYQSRNWTDFITLDPVKFVQNIFGGGDVQKTQLTITDLQVKVDRLKTDKINLEKELIIKQEEIKNKVANLLFKLTENEQKILLIEQQLENFKLSNQVFLIKYSNGEGTTNQYLSYQDKKEKLEFQLLSLNNDYQKTINQLLLLIKK